MGHEEAIDNLKFLQNLTAPCESLAAASPEEIPALLPSILHVIRLIWRHSRFYNSPERITGLLRKARLPPICAHSRWTSFRLFCVA